VMWDQKCFNFHTNELVEQLNAWQVYCSQWKNNYGR
jgi:hypothetical protein